MAGTKRKTEFHHDDEHIGKIGEKWLSEFLAINGNTAIDCSEIKEFQFMDIDFLDVKNDSYDWKEIPYKILRGEQIDPKDVISYEVKTDTQGIKTGNMVYEFLSNSNEGCCIRSKANYICYIYIGEDETDKTIHSVFMIDRKKLNLYVLKHFSEIKDKSDFRPFSMRRGKDNAAILLLKMQNLIDNGVVSFYYHYQNYNNRPQSKN